MEKNNFQKIIIIISILFLFSYFLFKQKMEKFENTYSTPSSSQALIRAPELDKILLSNNIVNYLYMNIGKFPILPYYFGIVNNIDDATEIARKYNATFFQLIDKNLYLGYYINASNVSSDTLLFSTHGVLQYYSQYGFIPKLLNPSKYEYQPLNSSIYNIIDTTFFYPIQYPSSYANTSYANSNYLINEETHLKISLALANSYGALAFYFDVGNNAKYKTVFYISFNLDPKINFPIDTTRDSSYPNKHKIYVVKSIYSVIN